VADRGFVEAALPEFLARRIQEAPQRPPAPLGLGHVSLLVGQT
jgi:hypothetical protein